MAFIMGSRKILQRKAYDVLSHKYSFVFVLLGFLILTVSFIQFGEVWIEWNQSEIVYNSFSDNVVGKPLQKKLCQIMPIDIVYTWVNGSDPVLLQQMLKHHDYILKTSVKCHFAKCMPSHFAAYRGWVHPSNIHYKFRNIQVKDSNNFKILHNWTLVEHSSPQAVMKMVHSAVDLKVSNVSFSHAYWTSDKLAPNSLLVPEAVIYSGLPPEILAKISAMSFRALSLNFHMKIKKVWVDDSKNILLIELLKTISSEELTKMNNTTVFGYNVSVTNAYLIMELPPPWDSKDLAPSRFEDNEELRYSLRSLEIHAPWVRHVYLVTNGQIPYWLNLDNPRLTLLTHEDIFVNHSHLPTFSSPAIESHIHRIPGLSQQFLYLNDDVFFGQDVWPEDFITHANGQKVYLSWMVPDCTESCPWSWIGDGSCDLSCNISDCSFDGGDCNTSHEHFFLNDDFYDEHQSDILDTELNDHNLLDNNRIFGFQELTSLHEDAQRMSPNDRSEVTGVYRKQNFNWDLKLTDENIMSPSGEKMSSLPLDSSTANFSIVQNLYAINHSIQQPLMKNVTSRVDGGSSIFLKKALSFSTASKSNLLLNTNYSSEINLRKYNSSKFPLNSKAFHKMRVKDSTALKRKWKSVSGHKIYNLKDTGKASWGGKKFKDTFAESLLYVNRLYNNEFGFEVRKVPAHMPHLIDKSVMENLQNRFPSEWDQTSSHKVRSPNDMQFAFSYFYFLMSEKQNRSVSEIFDNFDTDHSGTWSDREIRTLLTQINELPLSYQKVVQFEEQISNCSLYFNENVHISTPPYERYLDSRLPVVTKNLIASCELIRNVLLQKFGSFKKYQTEIVKDKNQVVTFKMLNSNLSHLIVVLDEVRRDPKKFICFNDNLDPNLEKDNTVIRAVLQDFYESLFPLPSSFELPLEYRNRFLHVSELKTWQSGRSVLRNCIYLCLILLLVFTILSFLQVECCVVQRRSRRIYYNI